MRRNTELNRSIRLAACTVAYKQMVEAGEGATPYARKLRENICRTARLMGLASRDALSA